MQSIQLSKGKKQFGAVSFPENWNELDGAELLLIARQLLSTGADDIAGKVQIFMGLLRNRVQKDKLKLPNDWEALLSIEDAATDGLDAVSFIYSSNNLTRQPFTKIPFSFHSHFTTVGPADDFNGITCGEYEDAFTFSFQFLQDPNIKHLAMLAAVLWRPKGQPYMWLKDGLPQTWDVEAYSKHFATLGWSSYM